MGDWRAIAIAFGETRRSVCLSRHLISGLRPNVPVPEHGRIDKYAGEKMAKGNGRWRPARPWGRPPGYRGFAPG